jgi:hypothetical protein
MATLNRFHQVEDVGHRLTSPSETSCSVRRG